MTHSDSEPHNNVVHLHINFMSRTIDTISKNLAEFAASLEKLDQVGEVSPEHKNALTMLARELASTLAELELYKAKLLDNV